MNVQTYHIKGADTTFWHDSDGKLHRPENIGPAVLCSDGSYRYYDHGILHRTDGLAVFYASDRSEFYYVEGKLHRLDGPAVYYPSVELKMWFNNGVFVKTVAN